jgi:urease accessory protein
MVHKIERVLGNLADFPVGERAVERIAVASDAMTRRLLRLESSVGDLGVVFADDTRLRDGDVLVADESRVIAVAVAADDVLVVEPATIAQALAVGHALGNRHLPVIPDGDALVVGYTDALADLLAKLDVPHHRTRRVMERPFVHAHAPHVHG